MRNDLLDATAVIVYTSEGDESTPTTNAKAKRLGRNIWHKQLRIKEQSQSQPMCNEGEIPCGVVASASYFIGTW